MAFDQIIQAVPPIMLGLLLLSAGIEDVRVREIADWKNAGIALLAPAWWWTSGLGGWPDIALQIGVAIALFALFAGAFAMGAMGGGDVKMIAALALWFPPETLARMLIVMSLAGGVVTLLLVVERRRSKRPVEVPYGVAIAVAGLLALREPVLNQLAAS